MTGPTAILADHRSLLREAMVGALPDHGIDVLAGVGDLSALGLQIARLTPMVVVVAASMPDAFDEVVPSLRQRTDRPRVLVLDDSTTHREDGLLRSIEAGADGFVTGRGGLEGLADAIRTLASGGTVVPPDMLGPLLRDLIDQRRRVTAAVERLVDLTPRERETLLLVARGLDHDGIADELVISIETARTHVHRIQRKLGAGSRLELVTMVEEHGLTQHLERIVERAVG